MNPKASAKRSVLMLMAAGLLGAATAVSAQSIYQETFNTPPGPDGTLGQFGWTATGAFGYSGTYNYTLTNAVTMQPIPNQSAVYMGNGTAGQIMGFYTVDSSNALSGFSDISFTGNLVFGIFNQIQGGGSAANESGYFLVQVGGNWYASATQIPGPVDTGTLMDPQSLTLGPGAANWITISGIGTGTITYGSTPGSDLSGPITGAGIVFTLNDSSYSTENYADFTISPVPEPGTIALCSLGGLGWLAFRRRHI